jgi:hypothetical protein
LRIHFTPADVAGQVTVPGTAEYISRFGTAATQTSPMKRPTHVVSFIHPYTGRQVHVPIAFPVDSTPRVEHRYNRIIFNYGSDTIEVVFLSDGSVDVVYNSGFLRPVG